MEGVCLKQEVGHCVTIHIIKKNKYMLHVILHHGSSIYGDYMYNGFKIYYNWKRMYAR